MNVYEFKEVAHAKCILVGEHAVLRGSPGIVIPVKSKQLMLAYRPTNDPLNLVFNSMQHKDLAVFFTDIIKTCAQLLQKDFYDFRGEFFLQNNIPIASGLGFSSAFCVALTRWVLWNGWIESSDLFAFARRLEDFFHGKSSGIDIAGVLSNEMILYHKDRGTEKIPLAWQPHLYLFTSTTSSATKKCIDHVSDLQNNNRKLAKKIDQQMAESVDSAINALLLNEEKGVTQLADALNKACHCFSQWGLITPPLRKSMAYLLSIGAIAVKPTGSGAGGYLISLWESPPDETACEMIPVLY